MTNKHPVKTNKTNKHFGVWIQSALNAITHNAIHCVMHEWVGLRES